VAAHFEALKRLVLERLLAEHDFLLVVVNPRGAGVCLPADLLEKGAPVGLNIGFRMAVPIPDLALTDLGLSGTLSFQRTPFACRIPWAAIVQFSVDDDHILFLEAPRQTTADAAHEHRAPDSSADRGGKPRLRLV
jgi:hypothetical protein